MHFSKMITAIDTHTMGEPTRVVTGGIGHIPGKEMREKKQWLSRHQDHIRRMLILEPRGHQDMFGAMITEPVSPEADAGVIFMDGGGYLDMCGHGSIGTVTVLLETGIIPFKQSEEPFDKRIVLDTPAGLVRARACIRRGRVSRISIRNRPSFWYATTDVILETIGIIPVEIAYGGNFFALIDVKRLGLRVERRHMDTLKRIAMDIRDQVNRKITVRHPDTNQPSRVALVEIYEEADPPRNIVVFGAGQIDRSPCGTGTCAKMAVLHAQGKLKVGEIYTYQSIFGTKFDGSILEETCIGDWPAIVPEITGSAFITGFQQFVTDENDPFKHGFNFHDKAT